MDRFDLEQAIMEADMSKDLEIAFARHGDGPVMSEDEVSNMLMALWQMSALRQWKLWDTFCRVFEVDEYSTDPEVVALRERENQMMRARNERLEKEITWLETMVNNLQMELLNYRSHHAAKSANSTTI